MKRLALLGAATLLVPALALAQDDTPPSSIPTPTPTSTPSEPEEEGPSGRDIVAAYNAGFHWGLSPGVFFPSGGGNPGFMMTVDFRYGFDLGSVILAPGLRVAGIFPSGVTAVLSAALLRLTFPLGHFGPFIEGGAGPGHLSDPKHTGLDVYSGLGAMYYFDEHFGLGVVASYEKLLGSDLGLFGVGPALMIAF
jgi:hypothetical protein